jgi:REP element-mobilizing transposase RayT
MPALQEDAGKMPTLQEDAGKMSALPEGWKPVLQQFDPDADFEVRGRNLPHWRQEGAAYFITFRLSDSLPQAILRNLKTQRLAWLKQHPKPIPSASLRSFQELFSERIEEYLSAGYGGCWLKQPAVANIVDGALRHFDRQRYSLGHFVIMPTHVHALVLPWPGNDLSAIAHSWKSYTANQINRVIGRQGTLWQHEPYDHIVRDDEELQHFERYIDDNPTKAHLSPGDFRLGCGSGIALP